MDLIAFKKVEFLRVFYAYTVRLVKIRFKVAGWRFILGVAFLLRLLVMVVGRFVRRCTVGLEYFR